MHKLINEPLQQRSRETANNVLDALDRLLREKDLEKISIQELSREAGASVSSIYARFDDKHTIALALHDRVANKLTMELTAYAQKDFSNQPLHQILSTLLLFTLTFVRKHQHVYRAAHLSGEPRFVEQAMMQIKLASQLAFSYLTKHNQFERPDLELRVDLAVRVIGATLQQIWLMGTVNPSRIELSDEALASQLADLMIGYISAHPDTEHSR